ncbi:D-alanyl-D-alanine carboxypeptidase/D-alanyl-D-alanine endopeptidase [Rickettsiella endosymbiont of Dermanyssus gallinae]|uniref:D-alanyl-D-alanine carboxypeptidase/D-alanyl-D-alanine endopeptidase n=1 Tax=Rickettsiella endosymbiont of Dermanyssus gallinae TaxID=2856608 RepID=UPI001C531741|nr:D-alanyl-D-alanine carboxypeptidase/D-alanyl-D-alanine-endopeptidase [Rickettsiella endosymbiont of Dermanyssus gallinae]
MNRLKLMFPKIRLVVIWSVFLLLSLLVPSTQSFAIYNEDGYQTNSPSLQASLNSIISRFKGFHVGVSIQSLSTGKVLYQYHANNGFVPASTLKLFTGIAALDYLGPHYQFKTRFLTNPAAKVIDGVLKGNLYIKFSGDPYLTLEDLKDMLDSLSDQKITKVQGNIVIDDTASDRSTWPPGRVIDDRVFCYAAPVTATIINRNCFSVSVKPNKLPHPTVVKSNSNLGIVIDNQAVTKHLRRPSYSLALKPTEAHENNHYTLRGYLSPRMGPLSFAVALQNPNLATYDIMAGLLKKYSIQYTNLVYGKTPPMAKTLAENSSPELAFLIKNMLKKSDNLIADSLLKKLGEKYFSAQGSWKTGRSAVQAILASKTDIDFRHVVLIDGSGLSRDNLVTPNAFVKLLNFAYKRLPDSALLFESLPSSGRDGTLKHRLGGPVLGRVHAKTGSMHGISSLAGYVRTSNNQILAFSILINDPIPGKNNQGGYRLLENRICEFLARTAA